MVGVVEILPVVDYDHELVDAQAHQDQEGADKYAYCVGSFGNYGIVLELVDEETGQEDEVVEQLPDVGVGVAIDVLPGDGQVEQPQEVGIQQDDVYWFYTADHADVYAIIDSVIYLFVYNIRIIPILPIPIHPTHPSILAGQHQPARQRQSTVREVLESEGDNNG